MFRVLEIGLPHSSRNRARSLACPPRTVDGTLVLVGSEAGSSSSHFEDYWLFDRASRTWRYAGGGNEAKWSPDSSAILWSTPESVGANRKNSRLGGASDAG